MTEVNRSAQSVLDELEHALDAVLELRWSTISRTELADVVTRVEGPLAAKMDAVRAHSVSAADDAVVALVDGVRTTDQLVSARVGVSPARVRADGRLGRWLDDFPVFREALDRGEMSRDHLEHLRKADNPRAHLELIESQVMFVRAATTVDWRDWEQVVGYWLLAADPDGQIPREQLRNRRFSLTKHPDGSVSGRFHLDVISGQLVRNGVAIEEQRILDHDSEHGIVRTAADRKADALVKLIGRGASRASGDLPAPLVHVVIGQELAEDMVRSACSGENEALRISQSDVGRRCELADGTPVHPAAAMAVLAVAKFKRLVLAPNSRPLDLGVGSRGYPKDIKLAMLVAARGRCRTPGCDAPYAWLQADHIEPWVRSRRTDIANGQSLCGPDNRHKGARHPRPND